MLHRQQYLALIIQPTINLLLHHCSGAGGLLAYISNSCTLPLLGLHPEHNY